MEKDKLNFYAPSSRGPPSSRNSSASGRNSDDRLSSSLIQAGSNIAYNKMTIDDTPNRQQEKRNLAKRLQ